MERNEEAPLVNAWLFCAVFFGDISSLFALGDVHRLLLLSYRGRTAVFTKTLLWVVTGCVTLRTSSQASRAKISMVLEPRPHTMSQRAETASKLMSLR